MKSVSRRSVKMKRKTLENFIKKPEQKTKRIKQYNDTIRLK